MKSVVALVRCSSYEEDQVKFAVEKGFELLGGVSQFAKAGEKILLKPNILIGDPPEKGSTTHPSVLAGVIDCLKKTGASISYGDSPAFGTPLAAAKKSGLEDVARHREVPLANFEDGITVHHEQGRQNKTFTIVKAIKEHHAVISIPKLKTHGFQKMTGCIKNQFGTIPGLLKGEFHVRIPDPYDFAQMLVDLNQLISPRLYIMDGIMAMEGNGPRSGNMVPMDILLFSKDPVALDATICRLIDIDPSRVPTIVLGYQSGMGTYFENEIQYAGDAFTGFKKTSFNANRDPITHLKTGRLFGLLKRILVPKPYIIASRCIACGVCVRMCPAKPKAVDWFNGKKNTPPSFNYKDCIRCYCCQELCPEKAIHLRKPVLRRLLGSLLFLI